MHIILKPEQKLSNDAWLAALQAEQVCALFEMKPPSMKHIHNDYDFYYIM